MSSTFLLGLSVRSNHGKKTRASSRSQHRADLWSSHQHEDVYRLDIHSSDLQPITKNNRLFLFYRWNMSPRGEIWAPEADWKLCLKWIKSSNKPGAEPEPSAGKPNLEDGSKVGLLESFSSVLWKHRHENLSILLSTFHHNRVRRFNPVIMRLPVNTDWLYTDTQ